MVSEEPKIKGKQIKNKTSWDDEMNGLSLVKRDMVMKIARGKLREQVLVNASQAEG